VGEFVGQELESHKTTELYVFGFVDHTHPTTAELFDDAIMRDGLPNELGRCAHWRKY
jgi:hypothetical protein